MNAVELRRLVVLSRACPFCSARAGEACRTQSGRPAELAHAARRLTSADNVAAAWLYYGRQHFPAAAREVRA